MSGFLYFVPDMADPPELEQMGNLGLAYAFEKNPVYRATGGTGPSGVPGLLMGSEVWNEGETIGYYPERQTWYRNAETRKHKNAETWVGMWNERRPGPSDVARKELRIGHWVRMGDGQEWLIPAALKFAEIDSTLARVCPLPHRMVRDEEGKWGRGPIVGRYAALLTAAQGFFDWFINAAGGEDEKAYIERATIADLVCEALAVNYHLSATEIDLLGLLQEDNLEVAARAVIDWPFYVEWSKKKATAPAT